jgi:hypothetical protein
LVDDFLGTFMTPYAWTPWLLPLWFGMGAAVATFLGILASIVFRLEVTGRAVLVDLAAGGAWWMIIMSVPGAMPPLSTFGGVILFVLLHHALRKSF